MDISFKPYTITVTAQRHAQWIDRGRVWVDTIDWTNHIAIVRFDPGDGTRSRQYRAPLCDLEWNADKGWEKLL